MRRFIAAGTAVLLMTLASCAGTGGEGYTIDGEVAGLEEGVVYLKRYEDKSFTDIDSALVSQGKFALRGRVDEPRVYGLTTDRDSRQPLLFFLDNEKIGIRLDEAGKRIDVTGSPVNDLYFGNASLVGGKGYRLDSLVQAHPDSPVGAYFLMRNFAWQLSLEEMKAMRALFSPSLEGSFYMNQVDTLIARRERLQVGAVAPDFTLPDVDGNPVSLSSFRGKYVLVDFWASWCPDCRKENPYIVEAYRRFKDRNFTVLGVSLDRKREAWLNAIEKDGLTWTHVSDLKDWNSDVAVRYAIRWIPTAYLLNPDGEILAVGLEGSEWMAELERVLGM